MSKTKRWFCRECKREWVDPKWSNDTGGMYANSSPYIPFTGKNCQVCGSPEIELIEYTPPYPGLDIPREGSFERIPVEINSEIKGLTTNQDSNIITPQNHLGVPNIPLPVIESSPTEEQINLRNQAIVETIEKNGIYDLSDMD